MNHPKPGTLVHYHGSQNTAHGIYCLVGMNSAGRFDLRRDYDLRLLRNARRRSFTPLTLTDTEQLVLMLLSDHGPLLDLAEHAAQCRQLEAEGHIGRVDVHDGTLTRWYLTNSGQMIADALHDAH